MNNRSSSPFILIRMVSFFINISISPGSKKGSGSESTFEVVRHLINGWG